MRALSLSLSRMHARAHTYIHTHTHTLSLSLSLSTAKYICRYEEEEHGCSLTVHAAVVFRLLRWLPLYHMSTEHRLQIGNVLCCKSAMCSAANRQCALLQIGNVLCCKSGLFALCSALLLPTPLLCVSFCMCVVCFVFFTLFFLPVTVLVLPV